MIIKDLIGNRAGVSASDIHTLRVECSEFFAEAKNQPLVKYLPATHNVFHKIKVRRQRRRDAVTDVFEQAFGDSFANLRQRAVFAYPSLAAPTTKDVHKYYVFPVNGYKYMYSKEVVNSNDDYKAVVETLVERLQDPQDASAIVTDLLKYTYTTKNLSEGIDAGSEIIIYGIPYYYAVRTDAADSYESLLNKYKG